MSHLGERVTDYVLGELSDAEKAAAEVHVRECAECSGQVEACRRTYAMLRSVPDLAPPQRIVFETQKAYPVPWFRRWFTPAAAAVAASVVTALLLTPTAPAPAPSAPSTAQVQSEPEAGQTGVQAFIGQVQESCAQFLAGEPVSRDSERNLEIQRVCSELAYWESRQRAASRESFDTARSLQLLVAQRLPSEN